MTSTDLNSILLSPCDSYLQDNVTVCFIELPMKSLVNLRRNKILYVPNHDPRDMANIVGEELRIIKWRFLQTLIPSLGVQVGVLDFSHLL